MADLKNYVEGQEIEPYGRPRVYMGLEELNELKAYRDFGTLAQIRVLNDRYHELINRPSEQEIRNKAIDEFVARLSEKSYFTRSDDFVVDVKAIEELAEQMKGGAE